jgi:hypothetical protein
MTHPNDLGLASSLKLAHPYGTTAAPASVVNRTHRIVRERAKSIQDRKSRIRALWIPLTVSFGMLILLLCAVWQLLDETEFFPDGIPDSAQQMLVLSMWCLPLSVIVLAVVWFRRPSARSGKETTR